jgi:hypothetical protein
MQMICQRRVIVVLLGELADRTLSQNAQLIDHTK